MAVAAATFLVALHAAGWVRRRPLGLRLPLALALVVGFEAALVTSLSPFHLLGRAGVLAGHAPVAAAAASLLWRRLRSPELRTRLRRIERAAARPEVVAVLALGAVVAVSAAAFAPGNWDSMTYRLARVAHWIQHRSAAPYPTHVDRQVAMTPGAEYVLVGWQLLSGTDRLAAFLQLGAWIAVVAAARPLARIAGAPPLVARAATVVAATVPMMVLQASGTQTDLVAAAVAVAGVSASIPFIRRRPSGRAADAAMLGGVVAAGALVKGTALVAMAPFLACALASGLRAALRRVVAPGRVVRSALLAAATAAAVAAPDAALRLTSEDVRAANRGHAATFLYPPFGEVRDRAVNLLRGVARHLPLPGTARAAIGRPVPERCAGTVLPCLGPEYGFHEDFQANGFHVLFVLALAATAAVRWRHLGGRARLFLLLLAASWGLFQLTLRDNEWISRLETPVYALAPIALAALAGVSGRTASAARAWTAAAAAALFAFAAVVALRNPQRQPVKGLAALRDPVASYYSQRREVREGHDAALALARSRGCRRIGLFIGADSYDYPLTWRAMQEGIATRHVFGADPWPCLVFADRDDVPEAAGWRATSSRFVFLVPGRD